MRNDNQDRVIGHEQTAGRCPDPPSTASLDLVIPFTTPELTKRAITFCEMMAHGIDVHIRLLRVQIVPFPVPLEQSPVALTFLQEQMRTFQCGLPYGVDIRLARAFKPALESAVSKDSVVVLASHRRPWVTNQQRLAAQLEADGYHVIVVNADSASKRSNQHA